MKKALIPVLVAAACVAFLVLGVLVWDWGDQVTDDLKVWWLSRQISPENVVVSTTDSETQEAGGQTQAVDDEGYITRAYWGPFIGEPPKYGCDCNGVRFCRCCPKGTTPAPSPVVCAFPDGRPWYQAVKVVDSESTTSPPLMTPILASDGKSVAPSRPLSEEKPFGVPIPNDTLLKPLFSSQEE